jgi:hypothetical protein
MRERLPLIVSASALLVAILGSTPLGRAAGDALEQVVPRAQRADFAQNAARLNGHRSSVRPRRGQIPVVGANGRLHPSIGAVGPRGTAGPAGAQGPPGASGYQLIVEQVTVPDGENDFRRSVACPGGKAVLSGGWDFEANHARDLILFDSHPVSNTTWRFRIRNDTGGPKANKTLYVVCANVAP